jgi:thiamine pyrophosphokinase
MGILPHVLIGDFDSIQSMQLNELEGTGVAIIQHPPRKDETDLELALQYAKQQGIKEAIVFYALGSRWDMTITNLLLPSLEMFHDLDIHFVDGFQEITLLRSGSTLHISGHVGDTISLIPVGGNAVGITSNGLEYPLLNDTLMLGSSRGVSNVLLMDKASIQLTTGLLLCIHIKQP